MNTLSIPVLIIASISFYVGFYHLLIYFRRKQYRENLTFAFLCFAAVLYDVFCIGLYHATSVAEGVQWQRAQFIALTVFVPAFLWFVADYFHRKPGNAIYAFSIYSVLAVIIQLADRSSLTFLVDQPSIKHIVLSRMLTITYYEATLGPFSIMQSLVGMVAGTYILIMGIRYVKSGYKREAKMLILAMGFIYAAVIHDTLVSNGIYEFIYSIEYAYLALILVMTYSLSSTVVEAAIAKGALRNSEERFRSLVETTSDFVWEVDPWGTYTYASPKVHELLGYEPEEIIGRTPFDLMLPEDAKRIGGIFQDTAKHQESLVELESTVLHKDGRLVVLETNGTPFFDANGKLLGYRGIDRDITERKQVEEASRQRAEQLATMNEIGRAVSTLQDLDSVLEIIYRQVQRIVLVDAFYIALHDSEHELVTFPLIYDMEHRYDEPAVPLVDAPWLSGVIRTGKPFMLHRTVEELQSPLEKSFGNPHHKSASILIVPLRQGERVMGALSAQSDIMNAYTDEHAEILTGIGHQAAIAIENAQLYEQAQKEIVERRRVQAEREQLIADLEAKNAELEQFTYTVSHDLKSPLFTIRGFLGFIEQDTQSGDMDRMKADIQRIIEATDKMQRLLNELLELSRIGRLTNEPETIPFSDLVRDALDNVHGQLEAGRITVQIQPGLPTLYGDRQRLVEVLQNLFDNAVKFMGDQPNPCIEIGRRGEDMESGEPVFYVRDNGIGIAPEYCERIFGLFNQLDPKMEGTGVGLALVKRIVEFHGGRVWVESEPGKGSTFYFSLGGENPIS